MRLLRPIDEPARPAAGKPRGGPRGNKKAARALADRQASAEVGAAAGTAARPAVPQSELAQRRQQLADHYVELQWDLGGMAYEMASRDHFRLDVLVRHAARLQQLDAELGEVERLLRLEEAGAAGNCPSCGALYARGAVYCWQCGNDLMPKAQVSAEAQPPPTAQPAPAAQPPPTAPPPPAAPQDVGGSRG